MAVQHARTGLVAAAVLFVVGACSSQPVEKRVPDQGVRVTGGTIPVTTGGATSPTGGDLQTGGLATAGVMTTGADIGSGGTKPVDHSKCGGDIVEPKQIEVEVQVEVSEAAPIALYVMLDVSGSMDDLWLGAVNAINTFVNDPASSNVDVALGLFPPPLFADHCTATAYDPPVVPFGRLPGHAGAISAGLPLTPNGTGTPIEGAVRGATLQCQNFMAANPDEECVVLFITDGAPFGCSIDLNVIVEAPQTAAVRIFTVGLPGVPNLTLLNGIASGTGTDCDPGGPNSACDLTQGASFVDALNSIRDTIVTVETRTETQLAPLECEWGLPNPDPKRGFDKEQVNVVLNSPAGAQTFANVEDPAACGSATNAWYYDSNAAPTGVLACPATCDVIKTAENATVDIQLGCPIVLLE